MGACKRQRRAWMTMTVPMRPSTEDKGYVVWVEISLAYATDQTAR